jgi:hypothetical protein
MQPSPITPAQLARQIRLRLRAQLYDDSGDAPEGTAIYSLSDPRDIRQIRYIGQTAAPRRRFLQHLSTARLWLPEETPWWVKSPRLRPLYQWIRELYQDEGRLPVMVISAWVAATEARVAEQRQIRACLARHLPLLNVERERVGAGDGGRARGGSMGHLRPPCRLRPYLDIERQSGPAEERHR